MQLYLFLELCTLLWTFTRGVNYQLSPKVIRIHADSSELALHPPPSNLASFDGSSTLLLLFSDILQISYDNGHNWQIIEGIESKISYFWIEGKNRAFARSSNGELLITEDQGKHWREIQNPCGLGQKTGDVSIVTNPFDRNCMLLTCKEHREVFDDTIQEYEDGTARSKSHEIYINGSTVFISKNGGRTFNRIPTPAGHCNVSSDIRYHGTECRFAASSLQSVLPKDLIYCIHKVQGSMKAREEHSISSGSFFYTSDLGSTIKMVEELKEKLVFNMQILPSRILAKTLEVTGNRSIENIWVSSGDLFKRAYLPDDVTTFADHAFENDLGRILFSANRKGHHGKHLMLSDSSGLIFAFSNLTLQNAPSSFSLGRHENLKGLIWAHFNYFTRPYEVKLQYRYRATGWFQKTVHSMAQVILEKQKQNKVALKEETITKISFDNGETWNGLKVLDPHKNHIAHFGCNTDDVEHCSLQLDNNYLTTGFPGKDEFTAGILLSKGTVGNSSSNNHKKGTFVSRNGGYSWELAFDCPMLHAFANFGNIIIAMPDLTWNFGESHIEKFVFSLDQGRTWEDYYFDEPVVGGSVVFDSLGLSIAIRFTDHSLVSAAGHYARNVFYLLDFSSIFGGKACGEEDLEMWYVAGGECINGVRYSYK